MRFKGLFVAVLFCLPLWSCHHQPGPDGGASGITPYNLLNEGEDPDAPRNTEASVLTYVGDSYVQLPQEVTEMEMPIYPRFIKTSDGRYLMFYHAGNTDSWAGTNCAIAESPDLKNWKFVRQIFPIQRNVQGHYDNLITRYYAGAHPLRLADGRLMAVASYRGGTDMRHRLLDNGLAIRFSSDEGASWTQEIRINVGTNWEPRPLLLPSGRVLIYYTDSCPFIDKGIWDSAIVSSGVSYIYSDDNGRTWLPEDPLNEHLHAFRQLRDTKDGQKVYTDQMPGVICLKGSGGVLVGTGESNLAKCSSSTSNYWVCLAYSGPDGDWGSPDSDGNMPPDRINAAYKGAAPTIEQFPSGEVVLTYNNNNIFYMRLSDDTARNFGEQERFFGTTGIMGRGFWGSCLPDGHILVAGVGGSGGASGLGYPLQVGQYYLNHDIYAAAHSVKVDGNNREWPRSGQALFVGSRDSMHATLRASVSGGRLYFLAEVENPSWKAGASEPYLSVYLSASDSDGLSEGDLNLKLSFDGKVRTSEWHPGWFNADIDAACSVRAGDGWTLAEFSIPLSALPSASGSSAVSTSSGSTASSVASSALAPGPALRLNFALADHDGLQSVRPVADPSPSLWPSLRF